MNGSLELIWTRDFKKEGNMGELLRCVGPRDHCLLGEIVVANQAAKFVMSIEMSMIPVVVGMVGLSWRNG